MERDMTTISTPIGRRRSRSRRAHLRKSLLTLHVVTAVGLLGSVAGLLVAATRAATRDDPVDAHAIYELMAILPFALGIPLSFLALGSGVVLGLTSRWRVLRHWWVTAKLALLGATILLGALVVGPTVDTLADGTASADAVDRAGAWRLVVVLTTQLVMVLTAVILAMFRPGGRTPWAGRSTR
jgi:hypothetical protein